MDFMSKLCPTKKIQISQLYMGVQAFFGEWVSLPLCPAREFNPLSYILSED